MHKKTAYKFMSLSNVIKSNEQVEKAYIEAFHKGYSVVELARVVGVKSAKYIHAILVKNGEIVGGKRGPLKRGILPEGFGLFLASRSLSYNQWCAGWGFEPRTAATEIAATAGPAMAAIKRDFPGYYKRLTGIVVTDFARGPAFERSRPEIVLTWSEDEACYRADIRASGIVGFGPDYLSALKSALCNHNNRVTIKRLDVLPNLGIEEAIW